MAGTIKGLSYARNLLSGGITSGELETELADTGNLGAMDVLMGLNYWNRKLLSYGTTAYNILDGSDIAKYRYLLTTGYFYSLSTSSYAIQAFDIGIEVVSTKASHTEQVFSSTLDLQGGFVWLNAFTSLTTKKLYRHNYGANVVSLDSAVLSNEHHGNGAFTAFTENYGGYIAGRTSGAGYTRNLSKFDYGSQSSSSVSNMTSGNRNYFNCVSSDTIAYTMGGSTTSASAQAVSIIDKITKATDSTAVNSNSLSTARIYGVGVGSALAGYCAAGQNTSSTSQDSIEKILYSTEAVSTIAAVLTQAQNYGSGLSGKDDGFMTGGYDGSAYMTTIDKLSFSDETVSVSATALTSVNAAQNCNGIVAGK